MLLNEHVRKVPLIRIFFPFICGVLLNQILYCPRLYILIPLLVFFLIFLFPSKKINYPFITGNYIFGILINLQFILCGYFITKLNKSEYVPAEHISNQRLFLAHIEDYPVQKSSYTQLNIQLEYCIQKQSREKFHSRLIAYLPKMENPVSLEPGDRILLYCKLYNIKNRGNPGEFNSEKYFTSNNIYFKTYINNKNWKIYSGKKKTGLLIIARKIRNKIQNLYDNYNFQEKSLAILTALSLGQKNLISNDLKESYSHSGAMHILAVSGLHVGIIYLFLSFLLKFLKGIPGRKIISPIIMLSFLWMFAFISGLSPSVSRATLMISLLIIGKVIKRNNIIYNNIIGAALILVLIKPSIITNIGFQLSFAAVTGIVTLYPIISKLIKPKNWFSDNIWKLCVVSFSAQLSTFPLSIFYFNVFPNYFLLTNLFVLPLVIILVYTILIMLLLSPLPFLAMIISKLVNSITNLLNSYTEYISGMPFSVSRNIYLSEIDVLLIYMIIVILIYSFFKKSPGPLLFIFPIIIFFLSADIIKTENTNKDRSLIIWNFSEKNIQFFDGKESYLFKENLLEEGNYSISALSNKYCKKNRISNLKTMQINDSLFQSARKISQTLFFYNGIFWFYDKKILILSKNNTGLINYIDTVDIDYLVIFEISNTDINRLINKVNPTHIIIGPEIQERDKKNINSLGINHNIKIHTIKIMGAYFSSISGTTKFSLDK